MTPQQGKLGVRPWPDGGVVAVGAARSCYVQELEHQLVAAAEEKTKVQSKFHELSIKHRQLIETSPQVNPCAACKPAALHVTASRIVVCSSLSTFKHVFALSVCADCVAAHL